MGAPSRRGPPAGSLEAFGKLMESLPTGTGPATTQRREQVWAQIGGNGGAATSAAMQAGLQYVQELERALPAGSRPLVMHSFQTAMSVASELLQTGMELTAEHFRLILLAMRKYLELYAHLAGPQSKARPIAVTHTEFEAAKPLLRQWGMRVDSGTFAQVDVSGVGVVRFDAFARWVMRAQLQQLSAGLSEAAPGASSGHRAPAQAWAEAAGSGSGSGGGPLRPKELNTLSLSLGGVERTIPPQKAGGGGSGGGSGGGVHRQASPPPPAGVFYGSEERKMVLPPSSHGRSGSRGGRSAKASGRTSASPLPSSHRSPPKLPPGQQTAKSHPRSTVPVRPKASKFDLAERLCDVGLSQYARTLSQLGFDDVDQLLALQHASDPRDAGRVDVYESGYGGVLDQLNLMPGHRIRMLQFFQNESRNAARAAHERTLDEANRRAAEVAAAEARQAEELKLLKLRNRELEEAMEERRAVAEQAEQSVKDAWAHSDGVRLAVETWRQQGKLVTQESGVQVRPPPV
jgi:hypothetical protein